VTTALDRPPEEAAEDTSFARGLRVFLTVADRGEIRADELSTLLDTPLSTIYRYLRTLTEFGFLERQEAGYRLGARLHLLGTGPIVSAEELIRAADPVLAGVAEATGETAFISRRVGTGTMCLAQYPSAQPLRVVVDPGQVGPLHVGSVARVLLAFAPKEVQTAALADAADADATRRQLPGIVSDSFARDQDATYAGAVTLAVPVLVNGEIVAAVAIAAPIERADRRWQARARGLLRRAAGGVEAALRAIPEG
jgi:DNA-binding IclR family transcriptional regulator